MKRFSGKVVIVTGGGSGIGRATGDLFAREDASVVIADINVAAADETISLINLYSDKAMAMACDISKENEVRNLISTTVARHGRIDVLINNAALFLMKGGDEAVEKDWQAVFSTNVAGPAVCSRYAAEQMKQSGGGSIVIVSSVNGMKADAGYATYCSSKAALLMLTRCLAIDFGAWNVRVNSVSPGPVDTPGLHRELHRLKISEQEFAEHLSQNQCLPRILQPEDVARSILFLASDDAKVITGANLVVDGGYTAGK